MVDIVLIEIMAICTMNMVILQVDHKTTKHYWVQFIRCRFRLITRKIIEKKRVARVAFGCTVKGDVLLEIADDEMCRTPKRKHLIDGEERWSARLVVEKKCNQRAFSVEGIRSEKRDKNRANDSRICFVVRR
ncbi:hypothetical protein AB6A40_005029 [Gnathostoma spinigerum]|uniref:Uncharacterized protein n=1 Tax=Gnathostoma spinigerum TaxID=75299 RepID=A0ABD6EE85_9BILA